MKYNVIEEKNYIHLDVSGEYDLEQFMKMIAVLKSKCDEEEINRIFLDITKVMHAFNKSDEERFLLVEEYVKLFPDILK